LNTEQLNRDVREFLRKRHRQLKKDAAIKPTKLNSFQWDYSYIPWKDWPVEVRREMVKYASIFGRTWIYGRNETLIDVFKRDAGETYNKNWDGCRDLWKEQYRHRKLYRLIDRPIVPVDPVIAEGERKSTALPLWGPTTDKKRPKQLLRKSFSGIASNVVPSTSTVRHC
jgi:hypothetical protein